MEQDNWVNCALFLQEVVGLNLPLDNIGVVLSEDLTLSTWSFIRSINPLEMWEEFVWCVVKVSQFISGRFASPITNGWLGLVTGIVSRWSVSSYPAGKVG